MKLLDQKTKMEMEKCKEIARNAGLVFDDNTLEYTVSNRQMLTLKPKIMIPTLYDYWVHDVETISDKWVYDVFPSNPYESVINTRPPISFYNQDNADWFNVMIFYHVMGHVDFFQNNDFFRNTWDDDFKGQALADKRLINRIRDELGTEKRWVDYVIDASKAIENLVGFYPELYASNRKDSPDIFGLSSEKLNFYFTNFLRDLKSEGKIRSHFYHDEIDRYNKLVDDYGNELDSMEKAFFQDNNFRSKFPEFESTFKKWKESERKPQPKDIFEYLWQNSEFLNKKENSWIVDVMSVIRRTSLYFQPQIRTKICNEGWASLWHQRLFIQDERMKTHESDFAKVDSGVTSLPRMGTNPYATGKNLFEFIEELARKGKLSRDYQLLKDFEERKRFNQHGGEASAKEALFGARKHLNDELLIDFLSDEDFQEFTDKNRLFVLGVRPSRQNWGKAEIYIKSKNGKDYRELLKKSLYHPPHIVINEDKAKDGELYLDHIYEGRSLVTEYIDSALIGLEFLAGKKVCLETTEYLEIFPDNWFEWEEWGYEPRHIEVRVLYTCEDGQITVDEINV